MDHGTAVQLILIAVIVLETTSQIQRFHDLKLECDERSVVQSHSNQYQPVECSARGDGLRGAPGGLRTGKIALRRRAGFDEAAGLRARLFDHRRPGLELDDDVVAVLDVLDVGVVVDPRDHAHRLVGHREDEPLAL